MIHLLHSAPRYIMSLSYVSNPGHAWCICGQQTCSRNALRYLIAHLFNRSTNEEISMTIPTSITTILATSKTCQEAVDAIRRYIETHPEFETTLNTNSIAIKTLINLIVDTFHVPHRGVAHALKTKAAKKYLELNEQSFREWEIIQTVQEAQALTDTGIDVNFQWGTTRCVGTPLEIIIRRRDGNRRYESAIVTYLISQGTNIVTDNRSDALGLAVAVNKADIVRILLTYPEIIRTVKHESGSSSILLTAVYRYLEDAEDKPLNPLENSYEIIKLLVKAGADPSRGSLNLMHTHVHRAQRILDLLEHADQEQKNKANIQKLISLLKGLR